MADEKFIDIDKHIEDTLVIALRVFMSLDANFLYNDNESLSKINISAGRPQDQDFVKPHIYIAASGYSVSEAGLSNGYSNDIIDVAEDFTRTEITQREYRVNFSADISIAARTSSVSKNLANRIVSRLYIRGRKLIYEELGMVIGPISKGRENKVKLTGNSADNFINTLSFTGSFGITVSESDVIPSGVLAAYEITYQEIERAYEL